MHHRHTEWFSLGELRESDTTTSCTTYRFSSASATFSRSHDGWVRLSVALDDAASMGVPVFHAPHSNTRSVAELVLGLSVMLMRDVFRKSALAHTRPVRRLKRCMYLVQRKGLGDNAKADVIRNPRSRRETRNSPSHLFVFLPFDTNGKRTKYG